jgi:hypothetical protein
MKHITESKVAQDWARGAFYRYKKHIEELSNYALRAQMAATIAAGMARKQDGTSRDDVVDADAPIYYSPEVLAQMATDVMSEIIGNLTQELHQIFIEEGGDVNALQ